jgi:phosphatidylglycerophosphatase C
MYIFLNKKSLQKIIAFFDFDGTITTNDTMLELIKFSKGKPAYYLGMIKLSPFLIAMKLGLMPTAKAKEKMLTLFFGGASLNVFNDTCKRFAETKLPALIRPSAINKIKEHLAKQHQVVVVSASAENWVNNWCIQNGIKYLATKLEVIDDKITGKLNGANCNGEEKVNRIKAEYDLSAYKEIYCYGDTKGDKLMLQLATFAFYKPFRP